MARNGEAACAFLAQELAAHPNLPPLTRHVMLCLSSGPESVATWGEFAEDEGTINRVVSVVRQSLEAALKEAMRPPRTEEHDDVAQILKKMRELRRDIKTLMPGDCARPFALELRAEQLPPVTIALGWHSLSSGAHDYDYPLAVVDVLEYATRMVEDHVKSLPVRAVVRSSDTAKVTAFIRYLAWHFHREFGQEKHGTIARIATVVFGLSDPLDGKDVEARLESRPDVFKPPG